jgi:Ca2+-binding EF-hand superfamily protein
LAQNVFKKIDLDGSGKISRAEAIAYFSRSMSSLHSSQILGQADRNKSGKISYDEWISFWTALYNSGVNEMQIEKEVNI